MDLQEPKITEEDVLFLDDPDFDQSNICLITGAATGIGRAMSLAAAANNLYVFGLDKNEEQGQETKQMAKDMGGKMEFVSTDLNKDSDIESAVSYAAGEGNIKFLLNIAGVQHIDSIENFPMDKFDQMQNLMLRAPFYLSKLCIPHMKNSRDGTGVIGNMASVHAHITTKNKPVYNITKFGLRALSQSISAEGEGKIRSFTASTGYVKTPLVMNQIPDQAKQRNISPEEVVSDVMLGNSQVKDLMRPIDVANLFLFGMSKYSKYLVGGDLLFDGGMVLTY